MLIIDELGYVPFSKQGAQLIFQILAERHERKPVMITTNMGFGDWTQIFGDPSMTAALFDANSQSACDQLHLGKLPLKDTLKSNQERRSDSDYDINFSKQRLETIDLQISQENTTWFDDDSYDHDIHMITDFEGGLLISPRVYEYPLWIEESCRAAVDYSNRKAVALKAFYTDTVE